MDMYENITLGHIGGMGATILPTGDIDGSGDIPSDNDTEKKKKKMKYLKTIESFLAEAATLKQSSLSPSDYQKVKKLKDFNVDDWRWNGDTQLYDRVEESLSDVQSTEHTILSLTFESYIESISSSIGQTSSHI